MELLTLLGCGVILIIAALIAYCIFCYVAGCIIDICVHFLDVIFPDPTQPKTTKAQHALELREMLQKGEHNEVYPVADNSANCDTR